jgi:uncharacterized protein YfaS (alpha-2-macroglobulin family)
MELTSFCIFKKYKKLPKSIKMKTKISLIILFSLFIGTLTNINAQDMKFYIKNWQKVDSLEKKQLPKSALEVVDEIYSRAKEEKNSEQVIKSFIFRLKFKNTLEENAFEKLCFELDSTAATVAFPDNAIMYSMVADMYWWYYQNNRYKFYQRTNTANFDNKDMQTWTLDALVGKIIESYNKALENKNGLWEIKVEKYKELIYGGSKPKNLRPTLYDFIVNKAIDFYSNSEIALTKPADYFQIQDDFYFDDAEVFSSKKVESNDTLSLHYNAILLLKDLLKTRLAYPNEQDALIDVDLKRLRFNYAYSVNPNKDALYLDALKRLENKYISNSFSVEVSLAIAQFYYTQSSKYNPKEQSTELYKSYKKTAHEICNRIVEKAPNLNAAEYAKSIIYSIENHELSYNIENVLGAGQKFSVLLNYRNTNKAFVKVASIDRATYNRITEKYYDKEAYDKILKSSIKVYEFNRDLPQEADYNNHSVELLMDGLPLGFYVLLISDNQNYTYNKGMSAYGDFAVSNISYIKQEMYDGSFRFLVLNRSTGLPLQGVNCQTWCEKYNYSLSKYVRKNGPAYITDVNGSFIMKSKKSADSEYWKVDFTKGTDFLSTVDQSNLYYRDNEKYTSTQVFFFTDRAIYRPGQTIYFKGICIESKGIERKIQSNYTTTVYLYDVNRQKVSELAVKTNEYGTFSGSFTIPMGLLNGNFEINCYGGAKSISVEEYKRPKFEVEMLPFKGNYILNDDVEVEGKAISYSGAAISDANVKYRIIRTPNWNGWWTWRFSPVPVEIKNGDLVTDEAGIFKLKFKALPDKALKESEYLFFSYKIIVDVTDINGETQSTSKSLNVGYRALTVSLPIENLINKNNPIYNDKEESKIQIGTYNLNYEFVEASGEIVIHKLKDLPTSFRAKKWDSPDKQLYSKDEWYKNFPGNIYLNENENQNLETDQLVYSSKFNTKEDKELDISFVKNFEAGRYAAEIVSVDAFGNKVSSKHFFNVYSTSENKIPYNEVAFFAPVSIYCEPGEKAQFLIGSGLNNVKVLYEVEHQGQIISSNYLEINNEQKFIEIPVEEKHRGNFSVNFVFIKDNRLYNFNSTVIVPYSNKNLDIEFETFRDKLYPGQKEQWRIKIAGPKGDKVAAEMLATLYDASLDQFRKNYWDFNIYQSFYAERLWNSSTFEIGSSSLVKEGLDQYIYVNNLYYDYFNWFNFSYYYYSNYHYYDEDRVLYSVTTKDGKRGSKTKSRAKKAEAPSAGLVGNVKMDESDDFREEKEETNLNAPKVVDELTGKDGDLSKEKGLEEVKVRTNFNETAFFYPHLLTDPDGKVIIEFTVQESLTKWKMMGFATTKDLQFGSISNELVTQKDLMLLPNDPRFFRENDKITFPVKISNISTKDLTGKAKLELFDAITMQPVQGIFEKGETDTKDFTVGASKNTLVSWNLQIPDGVGAITYKVVAKAGDFSDGEQKPIPVLTNRMLVTESLPLPIRAYQTKEFKFDKLINNKSNTLVHHKLTLEFTSNPAWYAIQALPYLMEYPYECTEQTFSRFYANSIASNIANSSPKVKAVFDSWKNTPGSEALLSNLEKNQELKSVLLEETPWVLDGKNETERKNRVGLLFDLNKMADELGRALKKIQKAQSSNGGWPWFDGMPESRYITQHIITGMGHLDVLGVKNIRNDSKTWNMLKKAIDYLDDRIRDDYQWLKKYHTKAELEEDHLNETAIQYLYGRSYFTDVEIPNSSKEAFDYFIGQSKKYWTNKGLYSQGMLALALKRFKVETIPADIVKSLKEKTINHEELGMYWKENVSGYYWYQAPIETQALMIEVFDEVTNDQAAVNDLKVWLLKQKQTQDWKTTKATTEATYALLRRGSDWLESDKQVEIKMGGKLIDPYKMDNVKVEAGTGYFKTSWGKGEITPEMGKITVTKSDEGVSWGAVYWQYFEQLDKITPHETPLKLKKQLFIEKLTERGKIIEPITDKNKLKIGDKVIVRIELRVDRQMDYVHMKDMRASGFEPINVISRYKYQDGLGYYESTKDAATNFFMENLPKGTFVFEYPLRVTHLGDFSNGVTTIQCMYAPEFTSHSEGIRVKVEK